MIAVSREQCNNCFKKRLNLCTQIKSDNIMCDYFTYITNAHAHKCYGIGPDNFKSFFSCFLFMICWYLKVLGILICVLLVQKQRRFH